MAMLGEVSCLPNYSAAFEKSVERIRALDATRLGDAREVGRQRRPTTVGGLLIHVAEHTQRHVGQAITTAKIVTAQQSMKVSRL